MWYRRDVGTGGAGGGRWRGAAVVGARGEEQLGSRNANDPEAVDPEAGDADDDGDG